MSINSITLSDEEGQGERAPSRRWLSQAHFSVSSL
jgi:hypothetical protein